MTMRIAVVTDSTSGLTSYRADDAPVAVIPLTVALGDSIYTDGIDLTAQTFYTRMAGEHAVATTAQPPPALFDEAYQALAADGYDAIVSVHCANVLSGTVNSAKEAARRARVPVIVVDTCVIGAALGLSVRAAVQAAKTADNPAQVAEAARHVAAQSGTFFIVDDLAHLRRGGRLKASQAAMGQALQIKPLLALATNGEVHLVQRSRTWQRAFTHLAERVGETFSGPVHAVIAHADARERAGELEQFLMAQCDVETLDYDEIGPVVGAHVGRGACGVAVIPAGLVAPSSTGF